ncbi:MAG: amino acid permease [Planctomycetota bacterium]|nr:amino acid permease [Planctomycetota bacterium]
MNQPEDAATFDSRKLGLWDAVSIIVGIVVGTSIFKTPQLIFSNVSSPWMGMGAWLLGGFLAFAGALCYAELTTTYPQSGGDYVYLSRAFGPWMGFQFGWAQLTVILTGSIGAMAYAFGDYAVRVFETDESESVWFAVRAVGVLSAINLLGVVFGKTTQNILSVVKVVGLLGITFAGLVWGNVDAFTSPIEPSESAPVFGLAMVFVLYAFGGWNDAAFVASEVRDPTRNLPRALLLGTAGITVVYLLVNFAYLCGLGFDGVRTSWTPATDVAKLAFGDTGARLISVLVMVSALGAVNGLIFTGSRIYSSVGREHPLLAILGRWHPNLGVPVWSIVVQAAIAILLILGVGTESGRGNIDQSLSLFGLAGLPWQQYFGGFDTLVAGTAPVFWLFFLLTGLSLFVLRWKDRDINRPFFIRFPYYPIVPLIFCLTSVYMLYSSLTYAKQLSLIGIVPLVIGLPLYWVSCRMRRSGAS